MSELCPGIKKTVEWLQGLGYETTDSGDGVSNEGMGCELAFPHVFMQVEAVGLVAAAKKLMGQLADAGVRVAKMLPDGTPQPHIEVSYDPLDETAILALLYVDDAMLFLPDKS